MGHRAWLCWNLKHLACFLTRMVVAAFRASLSQCDMNSLFKDSDESNSQAMKDQDAALGPASGYEGLE